MAELNQLTITPRIIHYITDSACFAVSWPCIEMLYKIKIPGNVIIEIAFKIFENYQSHESSIKIIIYVRVKENRMAVKKTCSY